jgi:hypothetical protein
MVQKGNGDSYKHGGEKKRPCLVAVKLIKTDGKAAVVEKDGERVIVPASEVKDGKVEREKLAAGMPYGVDWVDAELILPIAETIDADLKAAGIWTAEDLLGDMNRVRSVAKGYTSAIVAQLRNYAREVK